MPDRKQTPDVLDDILGGGAPAPREEDTSKPASQHTGIPASQQDGKPARKHTGKTARQDAGKPASQPASIEESQPAGKPVKATFYLSQEACQGLDEAWLKLRKLSKPEDRGKISKSAIVEQSILLALQELQEKESKSKLAGKLVAK